MSADVVLDIGRGWLGIGAVTAVAFIPFGVGRVSAGAHGAWPFRLLLIPGVLLLWPLVLWRWARVEAGRARPMPETPPLRVQDGAALLLALAIPLILTLGLAVRQNGPFERAAVQIAPPQEAAR